MTEAELIELLRAGETEELATCESLNDDEIARHICALTNTKGGTLVIGVRTLARPLPNGDWFELRGVPQMRAIERQLTSVGASLNPPVAELHVQTLNLESRSNTLCVLVTVDRHRRNTHTETKDGTAYLRLGKETVPAGIAHVTMSRSNQKLRKRFERLSPAAQAEVISLVAKRFPASRGHSISSLLENQEWAASARQQIDKMDVEGPPLAKQPENPVGSQGSQAQEVLTESQIEEEIKKRVEALKRLPESEISTLSERLGFPISSSGLASELQRRRDAGTLVEFLGLVRENVPEVYFSPSVDGLTGLTEEEELTERIAIEKKKILIALLSSNHATVSLNELSSQLGIDIQRLELLIEEIRDESGVGLGLVARTGTSTSVNLTPKNRAVLETLVKQELGVRSRSIKGQIGAEVYEVLSNAGITTFGQLAGLTESQLLELEGFEAAYLTELHQSMPVGLTIGMDHRDRSIGGGLAIRGVSLESESCLEVDKYAQALAAVFLKAEKDLCFGLFGHWGRGKTYLMDRTSAILEKQGYAVVNFKAWKFRRTPETWAYLFRQFIDKGKVEDWRLPFAAALERNGAGPLIAAIWGLAFSLWMTYWTGILAWSVQTLGVAPVLFLAFTLWKFSRAGKMVWLSYLINGHDSTLGLQAAIGEDLKSLLLAWIMPKSIWQPKSIRFWCVSAAYIVGCVACIAALWQSFHAPDSYPPPLVLIVPIGHHAFRPFVEPASYAATPYIALFFLILFVVVTVVGPFALAWRPKRKNKVLLVVDDLDRCESDVMLEIIESTMLLLDDPDIMDRVQIAMLVEERSLEAALHRKYEHLWRHEMDVPNREEVDAANLRNQEAAKLRDQIVRENIEKIFLAQFSLPELKSDALTELFDKFITVNDDETTVGQQANGKTQEQEEASVIPDSTTKPQSGLGNDDRRLTSLEKRSQQAELISKELEWKLDEKIEFKNRVQQLSESSYAGRWGPRSVRRLLTRYQIARSILISFGVTPDAGKLIDALLNAGNDHENSTANTTPSIEEVANLVS